MSDCGHSRPGPVLLVGDYGDDDQLKHLWVSEARRHGRECQAVSLPDYARMRRDESLALVNLGTNLVAMLDETVAADGDKILYFPPGGTVLASGMVIRYCQNNCVLDAITGDPAKPRVYGWRLEQFRRRMRRLFDGERHLYETIEHRDGIARGDACFIATTFEEDECTVFEEGVTAAMHGLGIDVKNPRTERQLGKQISTKVRDMIADSKIVAANIRETGGMHNPNVFWEVGFSQASDKIILPCRHITDKRPPPIDIRDTEYLEYEDSIDLALLLYWGLLPKVRDRNAA